MGRKNWDRVSPNDWFGFARTVGLMRDKRWRIMSVCGRCHLTMMVDLDLIILTKGPDVVLWDRQATCKRIGCGGVVHFTGQPPEIGTPFRLNTTPERIG